MSNNPGVVGQFVEKDEFQDEYQTSTKGFGGKDGDEASKEGIKGAADAAGGGAPGVGAEAGMKGVATVPGMIAMESVKGAIKDMPPGGDTSDNEDKTEDPAFGDAGEANPPDPTPDLSGGDSGDSSGGGGDSGGGDAGDAGGDDGGE